MNEAAAESQADRDAEELAIMEDAALEDVVEDSTKEKDENLY